jgi:DNA-binding NtrC family response regulator
MRKALDESTTNSSRRRSAEEVTNVVVPALTVLWHTDIERIGDIAILEDLRADGRVQVSRLAPLFKAPRGTQAQPLQDKHLSRTPALEIVRGARGQLELRPGSADVPTLVHGASLTGPVAIAPAELDGGVIITIAGRFVLCLHGTAVPFSRGPDLGLVGDSDAIEGVRRAIKRVADLDVPVLIRGETGTGKEMVARALVREGRRSKAQFVAVNMAAIPATTAAAELFGHERGAFTGAAAARMGYFGEAAAGTIFLDEIGLTPPDVQKALLRALETGEILPLGAGRARKSNVRIMAATDAELEAAIRAGTFSEALFQRLARFQIAVPPLRDRREDVGALLLHFLREALTETCELNVLDPGRKQWLSGEQVTQLALEPWSANVRALRNAAWQIAISSRGQAHAHIDDEVRRLADTSPRDAETPPARALDKTLRGAGGDPPARSAWAIPPDVLLATLREHRWSPTATATALRVSRTTLYGAMDRHPRIRKANTIPKEEILRSYRETDGDLDRMAQQLEVSRRGLQLRLTQVLQDASARSDADGPSTRR